MKYLIYFFSLLSVQVFAQLKSDLLLKCLENDGFISITINNYGEGMYEKNEKNIIYLHGDSNRVTVFSIVRANNMFESYDTILFLKDKRFKEVIRLIDNIANNKPIQNSENERIAGTYFSIKVSFNKRKEEELTFEGNGYYSLLSALLNIK